jgi:hypothetical protein
MKLAQLGIAKKSKVKVALFGQSQANHNVSAG